MATTPTVDITWNYSGSIVTYTVPYTGVYTLEVAGASGGNQPQNVGGKGAYMKGDFNLTAGTVLKILVGQKGADGGYDDGCGGGGGTFIVKSDNTPLIIAGGGGGAGADQDGINASTGTSGTTNGDGSIAGGTNGQGAPGNDGGGGGGLYSNGGSGAGAGGGLAFINGGNGGWGRWPGGFGGGGGGSTSSEGGGGGGGYSGGAGGSSGLDAGGGGGSYNAGTNQTNISGYQTGNGWARIRLIQIYDVFLNFTATSPILKDQCQISATTSGDIIKYKLLLNGVQVYPQTGWEDLAGNKINLSLNYNLFVNGNNTLQLVGITKNGYQITSDTITVVRNTNVSITASFSKTSITNEDVVITASTDNSLTPKVTRYRVLLNGVEKLNWTPLQNPHQFMLVLRNRDFVLGNNTVTIEAQDDSYGYQTLTQTITKDNLAPSITNAKVDGIILTATLSDPQNQALKLRLELNGTQVFPDSGFTDYFKSPFQFKFIPKKQLLTPNKTDNKYKLYVRDIHEKETVWTSPNFVTPQYIGLMFTDSTGSFLTDDIGQLLKYLDFGTVVGGSSSAIVPVKIKNQLGYPIKRVTLDIDYKDLDPATTLIELSSKGGSSFTPELPLVLEPFVDNMEFYIRVTADESSLPNVAGKFHVLAQGDPL